MLKIERHKCRLTKCFHNKIKPKSVRVIDKAGCLYKVVVNPLSFRFKLKVLMFLLHKKNVLEVFFTLKFKHEY